MLSVAGAPGGAAARLVEHERADRHDQPGLLGQRDELARRDEAALGVVPAHERLGGDDVAGVEADDRLVLDGELAAVDRAAGARSLRPWRCRIAVVHRWLEARPAALAARLGLVHRDVGVADQLAGAHRLGAARGDADAGADATRLAARERALRERGDDALGDATTTSSGPSTPSSRTANSSPPKRATVSAARTQRAQPLGDRDQQLVADRVAERVVDGLEVVEVDEQHRDASAGAWRAPPRPGRGTAAVGQAGQRVVVGLVLELAPAARAAARPSAPGGRTGARPGVGGERLEQAQVGVGEVAHDAGTVGQQHRADDARLAREHREHAVADAALFEVARRRALPEPGVTRTTGRSWSTSARSSSAIAESTGASRRACRRGRAWCAAGRCLGREQDDLGDLGAEGLDRAGQQPLERDDDLGRARERAGRLVEELEALVALALGGVGAVGEETVTSGTTSSGSARTSEATMTAPASARLAFVVVTVRSIVSMRRERLRPDQALEREIAAPIRTTVMIAEAWVANSAKIQIIGPKPSTVPASLRKMITARHVVSVNCAMLKTNLIAGSLRSKAAPRPGRPGRRSRGPSAWRTAGRRRAAGPRARTSARCGGSAGGPRSAPRRGSRAPGPTTGCGRRRSNSGRSCTGPASRAAQATMIPTFSAQTPPAADRRRTAPFRGDMGGSSAGRAQP